MITVLDKLDENRYRPPEMRIVCVIACSLLAATAAAGCGSSRAESGRTDVVAAFYPLAFAAEQIGGDRVSVTNLTPPGAEPHDVELTPKEVAHIQRADVVLYLSHGFQPAVEQALGQAQGKQVDALAGIDLRNGVGDEVGESDPHVWLDPVLFADVVQRVGTALGSEKRANALAARIRGLDGEYRSGLAHCARREFVTSHAAFGYLAARYHLHQIAITGIEPEAEPSAQSLASLARLIRRDHVTTVFFETLVSPKLAETVAREAGATTAVLDPIEGLTPSEESRGEDYLSLMRGDLAALRKALGCR
jgi:zinc transport system substrate-binding protein